MSLDFSPITFHSYNLSQAFGFLTPKEVWLLRVMAWSLPENPVIVNIGAGTGTSGLAFRESRRDAKIYTVDISEGGPHGGMQNEVNAFEGKGLELPIHILGDSKVIGKSWDKEKADLIFIDGDHSYSGCLGDFKAWKNHLKPGGFMIFHDYERDVWPDVANVVHNHVLKVYKPFMVVDTLYVAVKNNE
jgi:predicted O-methyltransferase YrrM